MPDTLCSLEIIFVRHGQSTANAKGVWQGQLEFPLSSLGREQARRAGVALAGMGIVSGLYTSPLARAAETAEIISGELRAAGSFSGEVVELSGLSERHGGILQGRPFEQTRSENPELIEKFRNLPEEEAWSLLGAETDGQLMARFGEALTSIREMQAEEENPRAIVVSHGGVLRAYIRDTFGGEALPGTVRAPNASLTRLYWSNPGQNPELLTLAETTHLEGLGS